MGRFKRRFFPGRRHPYFNTARNLSSVKRLPAALDKMIYKDDKTFIEGIYRKDPTEIILALELQVKNLKQMLNRCRSNKDFSVMKLLLELFGKIFTCKTMPYNLKQILDVVMDEDFLEFVMMELMTIDNRSQLPEILVQEMTEKVLDICIRVTQIFSDSLSVIFGLYELVSLLVSSFHSNAESWLQLKKNNIYELFTSFTELKCSVLRKWIKPATSNGTMSEVQVEESKHFRDIRIIPNTSRDAILADIRKYLPNDRHDKIYNDPDEYLDRQFRLMREDFMFQFRKGLEQYLDTTSNDQNLKRNPYVRVYSGVFVCALACKKHVLYSIEFNARKLKKINWDHTKRLVHGALVCLSPDNFRTMHFGTVDERSPAKLRKGIVYIKFECTANKVSKLVGLQCTMIETNTLFEAYRPVLQALQGANSLPFQKYILNQCTSVSPPNYLTRKNHVHFDLSFLARSDAVYKGENKLGIYNNIHVDKAMKLEESNTDEHQNTAIEKVDILDLKSWPEHDRLNVDESQYQALQTALTKEFSIIQGPPGTGKTYVGYQIVKVLLQNKEAWSYRRKTNQNTQQINTANLQSDCCGFSDDLDTSDNNEHKIKPTKVEYKENTDLENCSPLTGESNQSMSISKSSCSEMNTISNDKETIDKVVHNDVDKTILEDQQLDVLSEHEKTEDTLIHSATERLRMEYEKTYDPRPILIVCYTNHALDQFLEGIISSYKGDVLRVGGRSKCDKLSNHMLFNIGKKFCFSSTLTTVMKEARRDYFSIKEKLCVLCAEMNALTENVIDIEYLLDQDNHIINQLTDNYDFQTRIRQHSFMKGNEKLIKPSATAHWLRLFETFDRFVRHSRRGYTNHANDCFSNNTKNENLKPPKCLYDMSDESEEFTSRINNQVSDMFCLSLQATDSCPMDFLERQHHDFVKSNFLNYMKAQIMSTDTMSEEEKERCAHDIFNLNMDDRWRLYRTLIHEREIEIEQETKLCLTKLEEACAYKAELSLQEDKEIMQRATIIGMTTTCAAKYHTILSEVKPRIIIIEEAAEVFESHIISCLNKDCDQMILIGDHKQLRPTPATYDLVLRYKLDVSLFERMVENGIHCDCLQLQHRMRPIIADIVRNIYPSLQDHESVTLYKNVHGIAKDMFFVSHDHEELYDEEQKSYSNQHEAEFVATLAKYIIQQGYESSSITVLTTYKSQLFLLKQLLNGIGGTFQTPKVTIVDNYQGEENDIVLLSLVRSNKSGKVGFLKKSNRICVALSRAKKGLYIIGNLKQLTKSSPLWRNIGGSLCWKELTGYSLSLYCQNHKQELATIASAADFQLVPEGGCQKNCSARLPCGHVCERKCHIIDSNHERFVCKKQCGKKCRNGHICRDTCHQKCEPCRKHITLTLECSHLKEVYCCNEFDTHFCNKECSKMLPCGHICTKICSDESSSCPVTFRASLKDCRHEVEISCFLQTIPQCMKTCERTLQCGHKCKAICGKASIQCKLSDSTAVVKCPFGHQMACQERCNSTLICNHKCTGKCYDCFGGRLHSQCMKRCQCDLVCGHNCEGTCGDCIPCERRCEVFCPHGQCLKRCSELCNKCDKPCTWNCPHYTCKLTCSDLCKRPRCNIPCSRRLPCGHRCLGLCGEPCPDACPICDYKWLKRIHLYKPSTNDMLLVQLIDCRHLVEYRRMDAIMDMEESENLFKRCPVCLMPIRRSNRYGNVIKRMHLKIENTKLRNVKLRLEDTVLSGIQIKNYINIKNMLKRIKCCFSQPTTSASYDATSTLTFLETKVLSKILFAYPAQLSYHQKLVEASFEIRRYFDQQRLETMHQLLLTHRPELKVELKMDKTWSQKILNMKTRYDAAKQSYIESLLQEMATRSNQDIHTIFRFEYIPIQSEVQNDIDQTDSKEVVLSQDKLTSDDTEPQCIGPVVLKLKLYFPNVSPFCHCGIPPLLVDTINQQEKQTHKDREGSTALTASSKNKTPKNSSINDTGEIKNQRHTKNDSDEVKSSDAVRVLSRKRKKENDHDGVTRKRNKCQDYVKEGTRKRTQDQEATCLKSKVPRHDEKETKRVEKGPSKAGSIEHRHDSSKPVKPNVKEGLGTKSAGESLAQNNIGGIIETRKGTVFDRLGCVRENSKPSIMDRVVKTKYDSTAPGTETSLLCKVSETEELKGSVRDRLGSVRKNSKPSIKDRLGKMKCNSPAPGGVESEVKETEWVKRNAEDRLCDNPDQLSMKPGLDRVDIEMPSLREETRDQSNVRCSFAVKQNVKERLGYRTATFSNKNRFGIRDTGVTGSTERKRFHHITSSKELELSLPRTLNTNSEEDYYLDTASVSIGTSEVETELENLNSGYKHTWDRLESGQDNFDSVNDSEDNSTEITAIIEKLERQRRKLKKKVDLDYISKSSSGKRKHKNTLKRKGRKGVSDKDKCSKDEERPKQNSEKLDKDDASDVRLIHIQNPGVDTGIFLDDESGPAAVIAPQITNDDLKAVSLDIQRATSVSPSAARDSEHSPGYSPVGYPKP